MNGLIIINKEKGLTSHDYVNKIRRIFNTKKVGHLGTLDPLATGVLVVCLNEATKLVQFLESDTKEYIATILLGKSTDTLDITGNILEDKKIDRNISVEEIDSVLNSFLGKSKQLPPMYSAIKKDGKKLYEYAREGKSVDVEEREIEIFEIKRIGDLENLDGYLSFKFKVNVSKGTYIRSLCYDIAARLDTIGTMLELQRTRSGIFRIENSSNINDIENGNYNLFSMKEALANYPFIEDEQLCKKAYSGMKISINNIKELINEIPSRIVIGNGENITAIYDLDNELHCYKAVRVWN